MANFTNTFWTLHSLKELDKMCDKIAGYFKKNGKFPIENRKSKKIHVLKCHDSVDNTFFLFPNLHTIAPKQLIKPKNNCKKKKNT